MSAFGSRASNVLKPGANLSRALERKGLFHFTLREDARHTLGFQTQSTGKDGEKKKTQFIKPGFNVLFSVCVDGTNNDSQRALAKDVTETDIGQAESETLSSLSIRLFRALCRGKRSVQSKIPVPHANLSICLAYMLASFLSV